MKTKILTALVLATLSTSGTSTALEASAGNGNMQNVATGLETRMQAGNALLMTSINQILACNKKGMFFSPDDTGADADGCRGVDTTSYEIVFEQKRVPVSSSCKSPGGACTVTIPLAAYDLDDKIEPSVEASCRDGGWCPNNAKGSLLLDLKASWKDKRVVADGGGGGKYNIIDASYDKPTNVLTLKAYYSGKDTKNYWVSVQDVAISYKAMVLKEIK
ncbi:MAG: hypothetical protein KDI55_20280 [Anaerolineae bacterium]|nr:hypothetical protein [Anaerolineae bacterium]